MRRLALLFLIVMLSACAAAPDRMPETEVDAESVDQHQQSLADIHAWEFQSRMAFFELEQNSRQAASLRWQNQPESRSLRVSHPLRGTLARLEETADGATLVDAQGDEYRANDIEALLLTHLNVVLPIELIHDALLGRMPQTDIINPSFYADGTLADYQVDVDTGRYWQRASRQTWHVSLARYSEAANAPVRLPHELELTSDDYRIRLTISRWTLLDSTKSD